MSTDLRERFQVYASAAPSSAGLLEAVLVRSRRRRRRFALAAGVAAVGFAALAVAAPVALRGAWSAPTGVGASTDVIVTTPHSPVPTQLTSTPPTTVESVTGTVIELLTGTPIEGATVVVRDAADHTWQARSGQDGTFVITGPLVRGDIDVTVTAEGFDPYHLAYAFGQWSQGVRVTLLRTTSADR